MGTQIASFEDLTTGSAELEEVPLTGGKVVKVRGLSRFEYMLAGQRSNASGSTDLNLFERLMLLYGLAEPKLSEGQIEAWQKAPGKSSDIDKVHKTIMRLSKHDEGADKSDLQ